MRLVFWVVLLAVSPVVLVHGEVADIVYIGDHILAMDGSNPTAVAVTGERQPPAAAEIDDAAGGAKQAGCGEDGSGGCRTRDEQTALSAPLSASRTSFLLRALPETVQPR